ncbi:DUF4167 domain-containing protein [Segnochrobactraceae bacterium EtOH-i3]
MRQQGNPNKRLRGRPRKGPNPLTRTYESNGPDVKVRGTALHIAEKYVQLARDAQSSGDTVMAENYFQHAEHYYRIVAASQTQTNQPYSFTRDDDSRADEDEDEFTGERFDRSPRPAPQPYVPVDAPQPYVERMPGVEAAAQNGQRSVAGERRERRSRQPRGERTPRPEFTPEPVETVESAEVEVIPTYEAPAFIDAGDEAAPIAPAVIEAGPAAESDDETPRPRRRARGGRGRGRRSDAAGSGAEGGGEGSPVEVETGDA